MRRPSSETAVLAVLTLTGLLLRLFALGNQRFWQDEHATYLLASAPLADLLGPKSALETNPPLYYILQKAWFFWGDSRFAMRTLPALFGAGSIPVVYAIGRRLHGRSVATVAALLFISAPVHLHYAREIRCYSLLTLTCALAFACLLAVLPGTELQPRRRLFAWIGYTLSVAIALVLHNTAILLLPLLGAFVFTAAYLQRALDRSFLVRFAAFTSLACVPFLFWLPNLIAQATGPTGAAVAWIPKTTLANVYAQLTATYPYARWCKPIVYAGAAASLWLSRKQPRTLALFLVVLVGQPMLLLLGSLLKPMFIARALQWSTLLFSLLLAVGLEALRERTWLRYALVAALTVVQLQAAAEAYRFTREPEVAEVAAAHVVANASPRDLLIMLPYTLSLATTYAWDLTRAPRLTGFTGNYSDRGQEIGNWLRAPLRSRAELLALARAQLARHQRVWLFAEAIPDFPAPQREGLPPLIERLAQAGFRPETARYGGVIVTRVDP